MERNRNFAEREIDRPPASVVRLMLGLVLWLVVPWWIILGVSPKGVVTFAVCVVISVVGFGIAAICVAKSVRTHPAGQCGQDAAAPRRLRVLTGSLPLSHAAIQLLLVPAAVALGFTVIALVDAALRVRT